MIVGAEVESQTHISYAHDDAIGKAGSPLGSVPEDLVAVQAHWMRFPEIDSRCRDGRKSSITLRTTNSERIPGIPEVCGARMAHCDRSRFPNPRAIPGPSRGKVASWSPLSPESRGSSNVHLQPAAGPGRAIEGAAASSSSHAAEGGDGGAGDN